MIAMAEPSRSKVSQIARPRQDQCSFDLGTVLASVVTLSTKIPETALTAPILGTERSGHGILIDDSGLVVTIGYSITEAETVWLSGNGDRTVPAYIVGYAPESGLGLVRAVQSLDLPPMGLGASKLVSRGDSVIVAASGGINYALSASVSDRQEFAGYWEYLVEDAIFTIPAHPNWGGAALLDVHGTLVGVGSLLLQSETSALENECNMFVPVDLLNKIIDDLVRFGCPQSRPRPWLGAFVHDIGDQLMVAGVFKDCPAHRADLRSGDLVIAVEGVAVTSLSELFRSVWALGEAGVDVPLTVIRDSEKRQITVKSVDRGRVLHQGTVH